jgi:hypothetical protein
MCSSLSLTKDHTTPSDWCRILFLYKTSEKNVFTQFKKKHDSIIIYEFTPEKKKKYFC